MSAMAWMVCGILLALPGRCRARAGRLVAMPWWSSLAGCRWRVAGEQCWFVLMVADCWVVAAKERWRDGPAGRGRWSRHGWGSVGRGVAAA